MNKVIRMKCYFWDISQSEGNILSISDLCELTLEWLFHKMTVYNHHWRTNRSSQHFLKQPALQPSSKTKHTALD